MTYETERNQVIRKHINGIIHLNHIIHDGNSNFKHREKVNQICNLLIEKEIDFLTRPEVINWDGFYSNPHSLYPDVIYWIPNPFRTVVIEVIDTEEESHAEGKNYPSDFKVIPFGVDEDIKELEGII